MCTLLCSFLLVFYIVFRIGPLYLLYLLAFSLLELVRYLVLLLLSVGGASVSSALMEALGTTKAALRAFYRQHGDLGDAALECVGGASVHLKKKAPFWGGAAASSAVPMERPHATLVLTVTDVVQALRAVADEKPGKGVLLRKRKRMVDLLRKCRGSELKYMTRTMLGLMRIGASTTTILNALARAAVFESYRVHPNRRLGESEKKSNGKSAKIRSSTTGALPSATTLHDAEQALNRAFNACPNWERTVHLLLSNDGIDPMSAFRDLSHLLQPGIPVKPMLAKV
jgi:DNA ligase-1